jgi:16S rRNA (cytosine967-C5)-methyltransferase
MNIASKKRGPSTREVAGKVVHDVIATEQFSNRRLSELLDQHRLEWRDRSLCTELVYGALRWSIPLEDSLRSAMDRPGKIPPRVMAHWLVGAYQLQHLSETIPAHAAVNETVGLVKRMAPGLAGLTNAILRKLGSPKHQMLVFDKATPAEIAKAYGLPIALIECITNSLPREEWEAAVQAFNDRPHMAFRAFGNPPSPESFTEHAFVPGAYFAQGGVDLSTLLRGPNFVVQDPASQAAALLVAPKEGDRVIDMCAAPGMKSLILSSLVKGSVMAVDVSGAKKERMIANRKRMGLKLDIQIRDATKLGEDEALKGAFDSVLLDAPCSGLGTVTRHPEIRRRHTDEKLEENVALQRELLESASHLVKKGGVLVYSVCSPLAAEGSEQIEWFLKNHPDFHLDNPRDVLAWLPENAITEGGSVALWPHRHQCDAFFAARLIR